MAKPVDLVGARFGKLRVNSLVGVRKGGKVWSCICECGANVTAISAELIRGHVQSCGCLQRERTRAANKTHGRSGSSEYKIWKGIIQRCTNENRPNHKNYGGRGIRVCERWLSFANFLADIGPRPSLKHSIERNDNNGHYEPDNCRWATSIEQLRNTTKTRRVCYAGVSLTVQEWAETTGIAAGTLKARMFRYGWPPERALRTYPGDQGLVSAA